VPLVPLRINEVQLDDHRVGTGGLRIIDDCAEGELGADGQFVVPHRRELQRLLGAVGRDEAG
jgi:hypothetical protein